MKYPKWLEEYKGWLNHLVEDGSMERLIEMSLDAWAMAYNAGAEGSMTPGEFCAKYEDEPPLGAGV